MISLSRTISVADTTVWLRRRPKYHGPAQRKTVLAIVFSVSATYLFACSFSSTSSRVRPADAEIEPDTMHVLRTELDRGGKQVEVQPERAEQVPGVFGMVRAKLLSPCLPASGAAIKSSS